MTNPQKLKDLLTNKEQYALVRGAQPSQYLILDVYHRNFIHINDNDLARLIIQKMLQNGYRIFDDVKTAYREAA